MRASFCSRFSRRFSTAANEKRKGISRRERHQTLHGLIERRNFITALLQERGNLRKARDCFVEDGIGSGLVGADTNQIFRTGVGREQKTQCANFLNVWLRRNVR